MKLISVICLIFFSSVSLAFEDCHEPTISRSVKTSVSEMAEILCKAANDPKNVEKQIYAETMFGECAQGLSFGQNNAAETYMQLAAMIGLLTKYSSKPPTRVINPTGFFSAFSPLGAGAS